MTSIDAMRVALVHEWLEERAGSEQVFEQLAATFPRADLYALSVRRTVPFQLDGRPVRTTFLDRIQHRAGRAVTLPLMPVAWTALRGSYDLVITSSHAFAKWFGPARRAVHLSYTHTPARYLWAPEIDSRTASALIAPGRRLLRALDARSARWVDSFAANSSSVADRICGAYRRRARVIPPPVDTEFFTPGGARADFVLAVSRFIGYKRLEIAIEAAAVAGVPLVVAGHGPTERRLRALAQRRHPDGIRFEIAPSRERLRDLYRQARAFVFPTHEDFGIVAVEAQACGTPVVALGRGGALDTVVDGTTGILVDDQSPAAFAEGITRCLDLPGDVARVCRANAERFSVHRFRDAIHAWVRDVLDGCEGRGRDA